MSHNVKETLIKTTVTYILEKDGQCFLIENVPAKVNPETGEQLFSLATVEQLQQIILTQRKPFHFVETLVYDFRLEKGL